MPIYKLRDLQEAIKGTFYQHEPQKVNSDLNHTWKTETVVKSRGKEQNKQYFATGNTIHVNLSLGSNAATLTDCTCNFIIIHFV